MIIGDHSCTTMWYSIKQQGRIKHKFWYGSSDDETWGTLCGVKATSGEMGNGVFHTTLPCYDCQNCMTMMELAQ